MTYRRPISALVSEAAGSVRPVTTDPQGGLKVELPAVLREIRSLAGRARLLGPDERVFDCDAAEDES